MKVIAAYLLAVLGGNTNPCADDLKHILGSVGVEADDAKIELLLSQVDGKDLAELIAAGRQKLAAMPCAGEAAAAAAAAAVEGHAAASAASPSAAAAEDKEQKIEEESDEDMCFSLFD